MSEFVEKRRHRRHTSKLSATAVAGSGGLLRLATTIINLSSSGAMLELADSSALTDTVTLLYGHSIEPCTVVWKRDRYAGVRFDTPALGSAA